MHSVLVFFPRCFNSTCYFGLKTNICYESMSVGESSTHTNTHHWLVFINTDIAVLPPSHGTSICTFFFFFLNSKQVRRSHFHVKRPRALDPVSLLGTQGARCPFTHPVLPICQSSFNHPPKPLKHHSHRATVDLLPILSYTGHMSLERIYYTISPLKKSCKEASGGDKACRVKKAGPKEKHPIGTKSWISV